ncbi:MAG: glycosyltransferase family 39 protein [Desulfobacterales bacterium]|jgi:4-amino-4-deoxy-L-arabinose transferase-like glycosyltransferase|nr:glycosyltransferase family 39 protein [Desulfobacterales bacterium]
MHPALRRPALLLLFGALMIVAFYLRTEMAVRTVVDSPLRADAREYFLYAYNLVQHGIYSRDERGLTDEHSAIRPDAVRSPGYPLFLALFMGNESIGAFLVEVLYSQALISTLTVGIAFLLYRRFLGPPASLLAAALTALSPHLIVANVYLLTEALFCFFLVAAGWWASRSSRRRAWIITAVLGALLGAAYLIRPSLQLFPLLLALLLGRVLPGCGGFRPAAALLAGFLLVSAPWFGRNLAAIGHPTDPTLPIAFLHHGVYPDFMYNQKKESFGFPYRFDPRSAEISRSTGAVIREAMDRFAAAPMEHAVWYLLKKPLYFWSWNIIQGQGDAFVYPVNRTPYTYDPVFVWSHRLMQWLHAPIVLLGLLGCVLALLPDAVRGVRPEAVAAVRFVSVMLLFFMFSHMIGAPFPRYSVPLRPLLYGMAVFAGAFVWRAAARRIRKPPAETCA